MNGYLLYKSKREYLGNGEYLVIFLFTWTGHSYQLTASMVAGGGAQLVVRSLKKTFQVHLTPSGGIQEQPGKNGDLAAAYLSEHHPDLTFLSLALSLCKIRRWA